MTHKANVRDSPFKRKFIHFYVFDYWCRCRRARRLDFAKSRLFRVKLERFNGCVVPCELLDQAGRSAVPVLTLRLAATDCQLKEVLLDQLPGLSLFYFLRRVHLKINLISHDSRELSRLFQFPRVIVRKYLIPLHKAALTAARKSSYLEIFFVFVFNS